MDIQAIKVDVFNQKIELIEIQSSWPSIYHELECNLIQAIYPKLSGHDFMYIDEEGLFVDEPKGAFSIKGFYGIFLGNGLILGSDLEGNSLSCKSTVDEIKGMIRFEEIENLPDASMYII